MTNTTHDSAAPTLAFSDEASFVRLGLLLLSTDLTTEQDFALMRRDDRLRLHTTRMEYANPVTPKNLRAMTPRITEAAGTLPPETPLKAIYYSCTAATAVIGDDVVLDAVHAACPGVPVVTPLNAAFAALRALNAGSISILAPYMAESVRPVADAFEGQGFTTRNVLGLGLDDDRDMARLTPETLVEAAVQAHSPGADALFISCTALRSCEVVSRVEERIGCPVVTSNQAAVWRLFSMAGLVMPGREYGQLMTVSEDR